MLCLLSLGYICYTELSLIKNKTYFHAFCSPLFAFILLLSCINFVLFFTCSVTLPFMLDDTLNCSSHLFVQFILLFFCCIFSRHHIQFNFLSISLVPSLCHFISISVCSSLNSFSASPFLTISSSIPCHFFLHHSTIFFSLSACRHAAHSFSLLDSKSSL